MPTQAQPINKFKPDIAVMELCGTRAFETQFIKLIGTCYHPCGGVLQHEVPAKGVLSSIHPEQPSFKNVGNKFNWLAKEKSVFEVPDIFPSARLSNISSAGATETTSFNIPFYPCLKV